MAMRPVAVGIFCCEPQMDGAATQLADNPGLTANGPKSNLQTDERSQQPHFASEWWYQARNRVLTSAHALYAFSKHPQTKTS